MEPTQSDDPIAGTTTGQGRASRTRRRLATGGLALALLTGSAVTFNAVAGASADPNPPTTSTTVDATPATDPAISTTTEANPTPAPNDPDHDRIAEEEGHVAIPLDDPHLDPHKMVAELRAAGIPARVALEETEPWPDHDLAWTEAHPDASSSGTATQAGEDWQRGKDIPPNTVTWIDVLVANPHHPPAGETGPSPAMANEDQSALVLPRGQGQDVVLFVSK